MIGTANSSACQNEDLIAYLDGELDTRAHELFETHLAECAACAAEFRSQQRLLSELEGALTDDARLELPKDFARVVAARAKSDLSGVREKGERRRAFSLCALLLGLSVALLGGATASESVLGPARVIFRSGAALFSFFGRALYDAGAGIAVISRGVGGHFLFESRPLGFLTILLFVTAVFMLRRLIVGYHREQTV